MAREGGSHYRGEAIPGIFSIWPQAAATWPGRLARLRLGSVVVGADFCLPMLEIARRKRIPLLVQADGLQLPFRDGMFDALTVAFGLRNMASWNAALQEMARVLRPGGVLLVMDFSLPEFASFEETLPPLSAHVLPRFAAAITGNKEAYEYLGSSIESFPRGRQMQELVKSSGFSDFSARPLCCGIASIYTARKSLIGKHPVRFRVLPTCERGRRERDGCED